jgi:tyrosinase
MPLPPKGDPWNYTPADMADLSKLNYTYDNLKTPALAAAPAKKDIAVMTAKRPKVELVGASPKPVKISGAEMIPATVQMDKKVRQKMTASLSAAEGVPDRVFLNLENIRGLNDATAFQVFVNGQLAGTIALFGVRKATQADDEHGGEGLTHVLEITKLASELHLKGQLDADKLDVRIVPVKPVPKESKVSIGRISLFRQGR